MVIYNGWKNPGRPLKAQILIIDDDVVMTELLSQAIKERGHDIVCTYTLAEGLSEAKPGSFAVVYLDVCLPMETVWTPFPSSGISSPRRRSSS